MNRLNHIKAGRTVVFVSVEGGRGAEKRLIDMGLIPGEVIKVVSNFSMGPLMVNIKGVKLALGHGLAKKILVKEMA